MYFIIIYFFSARFRLSLLKFASSVYHFPPLRPRTPDAAVPRPCLPLPPGTSGCTRSTNLAFPIIRTTEPTLW